MSATLAISDTPQAATAGNRLKIGGRILSGLMVTLLALDGTMKLVAPGMMIANSPPGLWPPDVALLRLLGVILLVSVLLYALPRTAGLGAVLLTGYLGGAVATHVRVDDPLFSHTLFGVYLGLMIWGALWLRDERLRALIPLRRD